MAQLRKNILANFAGQGWAALMQIIFIPFYIKYLGIEAYGLIGFYAMLQGVLQILDFGLSPTMTRELARFSAMPERSLESRNFVRTLETIYWGIGILIGLIIYAAAPVIVYHWINASSLDSLTLLKSVRLIGLIAALQWPLSFYQGGLMGLQRLVLLNSIKIGNSTVFGVGATLILAFVSADIVSFFTWQACVSALQVGVVTVCLWKNLPRSGVSPRFDKRIFKDIRSFATGMTGIMISGIIVTQIDKLILSKLLSLRFFGYYSLAYVVSNGLYLAILPVFNALFPRFSVLAASKDNHELSRLYHLGSQFTATLLLPLAAILALFPNDVLMLWTGNAETAQNASGIVALLVIGTALNGLMYPVTALQLSYGWTGIGLRINLAFVALMIPGIIVMATIYGGVGAASVWAFLNILYVIIAVPLTHRRILQGEAHQWFGQDVGIVFLCVLVISGIARFLVTMPLHSVGGAFVLAGILFLLILAAVFAAPQLRRIALDNIYRWIPQRA